MGSIFLIGGYIEGDVRISGHPKVHETFARVSGYVEQFDIHSPQATVREALIYSAWLRLPEEVDKGTREVRGESSGFCGSAQSRWSREC